MPSLLSTKRHIHFIGIGGIGMSALALILVSRGYSVSGSDQALKKDLETLRKKGITVFDSQNKKNIDQICQYKTLKPLIIISTAIPNNNSELMAAHKANLKILHRSDLLATLIEQQKSILVAGTHGKTTTSTILSTLLALTEQDPSIAIGGLVHYFNSNGHSGKGELLVAEADESDGTLVKFQASLGLITNLELDHTDHYKSLEILIKTMKEFGNNCQNLLANYDCPNLRAHFNPSAWWSIQTTQGIDFAALPTRLAGNHSIAAIYEKGTKIGQIKLPLPGLHNLSNAIGAIAACRLQGIPFKDLKEMIGLIKAPRRRFELMGTWKDRNFIDDYAHHPREIEATLSTARLMIKSPETKLSEASNRLVVAFQPHRYTRTKEFLKDFASALAKADLILISPVYAAGETPIEGANSEDLAISIKMLNPNQKVLVAKSLEHLTELIKENTMSKDLILTLGAGDINSIWSRLKAKESPNQWLSNQKAA